MSEEIGIGDGNEVGAREGGDASGDSEVPIAGSFQSLENPLSKFPSIGSSGFWKNNSKFVAAVAADNVGLAGGAFEKGRELPQGFVASGVAMGVVDEFEAINVEEDEGERAVVAGGRFNVVGECLLKIATVAQAGKPIASGLLAKGEDGQPKWKVAL